MKVNGLSHFTLGVRNLEVSKTFYTSLFGVAPLSELIDVDFHFVIGDLWFVPVKDANCAPASGYSHLAFKVEKENFGDFATWVSDLRAKIWQQNQTFGDSLSFEDPNGHRLEFHASTWQERFATVGGKND